MSSRTCSRRSPLRALPPTLLLLPLLALGSFNPLRAAGDAGTDPLSALWVGGQATVARLPLDQARAQPSEALRLPQSSPVRGVTVDTVRERALTLHDDAIRIWEADGTAAGGWPLEALAEDRAAAISTASKTRGAPKAGPTGWIRVVEADGSAWVARGSQLEAFGEAGQRFARLTLSAPLVGLEIDEQAGVLWTATADAIEARDLLSGELLGPLPIEVSGITALTLSPARDLWVAAAGQLLRLDPAGDTVLRVAFDAPVSGLAPRGRGLWVRSGSTLFALGAAGESLLETRPLTEQAAKSKAAVEDPEITALLSAGGQAWISDGRRVARLGLDGSVLSEETVTGESGIRSLALWLAGGEDELPSLEIEYPHEGERVRGQRPVFRILWSDDQGVDPASLSLTSGGIQLSVRCDEELDGASCAMLEDLPLGPLTVTATVADLGGQVSSPDVRTFEVTEPPPPAQPEAGLDENSIPYSSLATPRGIRPNTAFLSPTDIESIDTSSGNVTLRVPLGPSYSVGPLITYQLQVINNSNTWNHIPAFCPPGGCPEPLLPITVSMPNPENNAGLGWEIHFGRLYPPQPPDGISDVWERQRWPNFGSQADPADQNRWMYVAPDGAVHHLYELPGRPAGLYSKDGTYLRLRTVDANTRELDFPDGRTSVFKRTGATSLGTNFCGPGVSGCWRFDEMKDPYGNRLWVSYQALGGTDEQWTVFDSVRNTAALAHKLVFDVTVTGTARGDGHPNGVLTLGDGDEWGDMKRVLKRVETAGFNGQRAHFVFDTVPTNVNRGCPFDERHELQTVDATMRTPVLQQIRVLDGTTGATLTQPWKFTTITGNGGSACHQQSGRIEKVTAPSRGSIEYGYGLWRHPTRCVYTRPTDPVVLDEIDFDMYGTGLTRRKVFDAGNVLVGTWTYATELFPSLQEMIDNLPDGVPDNEDSILFGQYCRRQEYRKTVVRGPAVNGKLTRTEHFSSTAEGARRPSATTPIGEPQATDRGLPFTKDIVVNSSNSTYRFLSERVSECPATGTCVVKRKKYVRYMTEFRGDCDKVLGDSPECYQVNPTLLVARTEFVDDGGKYLETEHRQPDGAGHFRTTLFKDTYDGPVQIRTETTDYTATGSTTLAIDSNTGYVNPGTPSSYLPAPSARWILHPYSEKAVTDDGRTYRQLFQWNAQGSLTCTRQRKVAGASSGQDLVVQQILGTTVGTDAGLPVTEIVAGGDGANLGTALCSTSASGPGTRFQIDHTYQHSSLSKTQIGTFPTWYQAIIDEASGLPSRSFNEAGQFTDYDFDALGRLTGIFPSASLRQADTRITYQNEATTDLKVIIQRRVGQGPVLSRAETFYDFLARPYREIAERPLPGGGVAETEVKTLFDAVGRVSRVTTRQTKNAVDINKATFYADYDVFGRPRRVTRPDGQLERLTYQGERYVQSQVDIMTPTGLSSAATTTLKDALGRVVRVSNPEFTTDTSYDPYGKVLSMVRLNGSQPQQRTYGYDGRGFLLSETLPEIDGTISYQHNAFGQVTRSQGPRDLSFDYDGAGRKTAIRETATGRLWSEWEWGTANGVAANGAGDYRKGKLVRAVRHNYPQGSPWAVVEDYQYGGEGSQVSRKTTFFHWPDQGLDGARFFQDYDYDDLGNRNSLVYPRCETLAGVNYCNGSNDLPGPLHTVTTAFDRGLPVGVQSSLGPAVSFEYHPNLQLARASYSNGVLGTLDQGTNGMPRSRRRYFTLNGTGSVWDSGFYEYDGAGNVHTVGSDSYVYDKASRLLRGDVRRAGQSAWEAYTYDRLDNLLSIDGDAVAPTSYNVSPQTNRLLGNGDITYDASGNMTGVATIGTPPLPLYEMAYDALNMQAQFISRNPQNLSQRLYVYGPGNYRFAEFDLAAAQPVRTVTLRDLDGKILSEYEVTGFGAGASGEQWVHQKDYLYGAEGLFATRSRTGEQRFFHADHLGSPRAITSVTGGVLGRHHYYPFGSELAGGGPADEPKAKFTGHERDSHGLSDYMLGRYYLHPFQRFSSPDPARDGWNLYAYVGNNPIGFNDPTGLADDLADAEEEKQRQSAEEFFLDFLEASGRSAPILHFISKAVDSAAGRAVAAQLEKAAVLGEEAAMVARQRVTLQTILRQGGEYGSYLEKLAVVEKTLEAAAAQRRLATATAKLNVWLIVLTTLADAGPNFFGSVHESGTQQLLYGYTPETANGPVFGSQQWVIEMNTNFRNNNAAALETVWSESQLQPVPSH